MTDIVIAGALRTAIGKFGGTLAKIPAPDLGATVIRELLARSGVKPEAVSDVIMGRCSPPAAARIRHARRRLARACCTERRR